MANKGAAIAITPSDVSTRRACLLAQMQPSSKQSSESGYRLNPTLSRIGHDSYYSNQDITILHDVVVAAQEELDHALDPKPLPAAVLFRAYDHVLPAYGVDPDSDHHLSAFVFRIGGEQGHGTLLSKFQAILARMGIVLEFGDDTPSPEASPSLFPSPASSFGSRLNFNIDRNISGSNSISGSNIYSTALSTTRDVLQLNGGVSSGENIQAADTHASTAATVRSPRDGSGVPRRPRSSERDFLKNADRPPLEGRRSALLAAFNLWRSRAAANRLQHEKHQYRSDQSGWTRKGEGRPGQHQSTAEANVDVAQYGPLQDSANAAIEPSEAHHSPSAESSTASPVPEPREVANTNIEHNQLDTFEDEEITPSASQQNYLLHCAARARQIYLASKILNRWADRTAVRLEREAVARRHMIRFRCFRGWSQVPSSKLPAADRLRACTAIQKLQRGVVYQRTELGEAASSTAEAHSVNLVQQALGKWVCQTWAHNSLCRSIRRTKLNTAVHWIQNARETEASGRAATARCADRRNGLAMQKWRAQTEKGSICQKVAHHVRAVSVSSTCLDTWSDYAEVKRRSLEYRQHRLMERAGFAFSVWNLSARAQAARWRREYLLVEGAFTAWLKGTAQQDYVRTAALQHHVQLSKNKVCKRLKQLQSQRAHLTRLHGRAQLFLNGTLLLKVLEETARQRKDRIKSGIRRYLMMRYTQISSSRKKRNFLAALDHWKRSSRCAVQTAEMAQEICSVDEAGRYYLALANWCSQAAADWRLQCRAQARYRNRWLEGWDEHSARQEHRNAQAGRLWASERQRRCVKRWSIATLRRSGQAHTADMVLRRHCRESRSRVLQRWRTSTADQRGTFATSPPSTARPKPQPIYWSARPISGQRLGEKQPELVSSLMETPTRWTGLAMPMVETASSRRMTPVMEADDEAQAGVVSSHHGKGSNHVAIRGFPSTSTTPLASSVPTHLRRKPRTLTPSWSRIDSGTPLQTDIARPDVRQTVSYSAGPAGTMGSCLGGIQLNPTTPKRIDLHHQGWRLSHVQGAAAASSTRKGEATSRDQGPSTRSTQCTFQRAARLITDFQRSSPDKGAAAHISRPSDDKVG
ncbi:hypothetical protein XA68_14527 [Ophiocordyceps unilateralis]|uniref:Sfi1 spindle body domain-containing protein n=1 Tax=Ophiocordyceps unilateralis TaxID=268505 RepID=A0A2A9P9E6_OPHUN|nr:hypothetical protein XA68_14527 [Ophiocordyceps unilateralis]